MLSAKPRPLVKETRSSVPVYDLDDFAAMLKKLKAENGSVFELVGVGGNLNRLLAWTDEMREGDDLPENAPEDHAWRSLTTIKDMLDFEAHEYMTLDEESPNAAAPNYDIQNFFEAQRKIMDITHNFLSKKRGENI